MVVVVMRNGQVVVVLLPRWLSNGGNGGESRER